MQIQGKFANINSTFFCSTILCFAFLSPLKVKRTYANYELCEQKKCQAEESLQFFGIK